MTILLHHQHLTADLAGGVPWPRFTQGSGTGQDVLLDGVPLAALAATYGTPLQVISETEVRGQARAYRRAFPSAEIAYAGKAFLCTTMARWMIQEGLLLDVCSAGELLLARTAGVPMSRIILHGNAKTPQELALAHRLSVGRIVVDSRTEINQVAALGHGGDGNGRQRVLLRVVPGVGGHTHRAVDTGREDQQFGFSLSSGAALAAVRRVLSHPELELTGLHTHIGSQIWDVRAYQETARRMVALLVAIRNLTGIVLPELDLGGGHAVAYQADDPELVPDQLAAALQQTLEEACREGGFPMPRLILEPGRAIVARAGVTIYRVISVKQTATNALFVAVDGGMSDNPRPSLYDAQYTARLIGRASHQPTVDATVVGRHCEAGDILVRHAELPADVRPGDLLVMLCTGAYQQSMASNYNMAGRPPVISVQNGEARVLIRRETQDDLMRRDVGTSAATAARTGRPDRPTEWCR